MNKGLAWSRRGGCVSALLRRKGLQVLASDDVVQNRSDTADAEAEDQALDIEARPLRQVEETGRIPVTRNEERFSQSEGHGQHARPGHDAAMNREAPEQPPPRN